jgi:hypothetical protein
MNTVTYKCCNTEGEKAFPDDDELTLCFSDKLELRSGAKSVPIETFSVVHVIEKEGDAATAAEKYATSADLNEFWVFTYTPRAGTSARV